ncbi:hypothetical protein MEZE111188_20570 [Mesobacillus zeae]
MSNKKKLLIILIPLVVLLIWIVYSYNQPPEWAGESKDGV